jgi:hypothetical protein
MVSQVHEFDAPALRPTAGRRLAATFGLEHDDGWDRHSNPASVWTRFAALPLLAVAVWSREWLGWWSLAAIGLATVWMIVNPRFFAAPRSTDNWASKAVFGERVYVARDTVPIPVQFASRVPTLVQGYQSVGLVPLVYGLITLDVAAAAIGMLIVQTGKLWYLDRMVLLFEDMKLRHPAYAAWERGVA